MKKVLFLLGMFTLFATVTFAQARPNANARTASPSGRILDSMSLKNPVNKNATTKRPNYAARPTNKDKTDNPSNVVRSTNLEKGKPPVKKSEYVTWRRVQK